MSHAAFVVADASQREADRRSPFLNRLAPAFSTEVLVGICLAIVWTLGHGFSGIDGDSRLYMGRALADNDPLGVGRDMMFVMDGQSAFTIFRSVAKTLAAAFGLGPTVAILTLVNLAAWFTAVVVFVRAIAPGRATALILATAFVLPRFYTGWNLLSAGESIPVPRPLAEAGVLLAMAALCHGRFALCVACLAMAALFHPIMAAPGFGVLLVVLGLRDRRWLVGAATLGACVVGAGLLGLPLASRLTATIDPAWRSILLARTSYLFMSRWPVDALGPLVVRGISMGLACVWLAGPPRVILLASLAVGILGAATSALLGDALSNVLFVQAQLWRALWLPAAVAPVAAGICLWRLPERGAAGQIALAFLALAWVTLDRYPVAPLAACVALAAFLGVPRLSFSVGRRTIVAAWLLCVCLAGATEWSAGSALLAILRQLPTDAPLPWTVVWSLGLPTLPIMLLTLAWWRWPDAAATRAGAALSVVLGFALVATHWDARLPAQADADAAIHRPDLAKMLASRPGPVLWTEGDEAWYWLGRPNWNASTQGSSIVFSRELAIRWRARAEAVVQAGLAGGNLLAPRDVPAPIKGLPLDAAKIVRFCEKADAPAWIVTPLDRDAPLPPALNIRGWSPPAARGTFVFDADRVHWRRFDRFAVIACALSAAKPAAAP